MTRKVASKPGSYIALTKGTICSYLLLYSTFRSNSVIGMGKQRAARLSWCKGRTTAGWKVRNHHSGVDPEHYALLRSSTNPNPALTQPMDLTLQKDETVAE